MKFLTLMTGIACLLTFARPTIAETETDTLIKANAEYQLLISRPDTFRVAFRQEFLPLINNNKPLTNNEVLSAEQIKKLNLENEPLQKFLEAPATISFLRMANSIELGRAGIDLGATPEDLIKQINRARTERNEYYQVRIWSVNELKELERILTDVEDNIAAYIDSRSEAFGILAGITAGVLTATYAGDIVSAMQTQADGLNHGLTNLGTSIITNQGLQIAATGHLGLLAKLSVPSKSNAPSLDALKIPLQVAAGLSAYQLGKAVGKEVASFLLSIPSAKDRRNLQVAKKLLRSMVNESVGTQTLVLDESKFFTFSTLVGAFISLVPNQSNSQLVERSIFDIYLERCSDANASTQATLTRTIDENLKPIYTIEFIDSAYAECRHFWDLIEIDHITLRSRDRDWMFGSFEIAGNNIPFIGAALAPVVNGVLGLLKWVGVPVYEINQSQNMSKFDLSCQGCLDFVCNSEGGSGIEMCPLDRGLKIIDMSDILSDSAIKGALKRKDWQFYVEIHYKRERSEELQANIETLYKQIVEAQIKGYRESNVFGANFINAMEKMSLSEDAIDSLLSDDVLRLKLDRDQSIFFVNILDNVNPPLKKEP